MKSVSILGDSISTFEGCNPHGYAVFYDKEMQKIRGNEVAMIFQDPMTCMNPTTQVGKQIVESIKLHKKLSHAEVIEVAAQVHDKFHHYP